MDEQRVIQQLCERDILANIGNLIYSLSRVAHHLPYDEDINEESVRELLYVEADKKEEAEYRGFALAETPRGNYVWYDTKEPKPFASVPEGYLVYEDADGTWAWEEDAEDGERDTGFISKEAAIEDLWIFPLSDRYGVEHDSEEEAWDDCCSENRIEPEVAEVYEHYIVTSFMARKLVDQGEKVVDFCNLNVWCRTCTGQSVYMDDCFRRIAADMKILPGMEYAWCETR